MTIIQQARDVLARVRAASTPRPWTTDVSYAAHPVGTFMAANVVVDDWDVATFGGADLAPDEGREDRARADRALFLLTSDPDLLDAMDALLSEADRVQAFYPTAPRVKGTLPLAAAIVAADDRMSA